MSRRFNIPSVSIDVHLDEFSEDEIIDYLEGKNFKVIEPYSSNEVVVRIRTLDELSDVKDAITDLIRPGRGISFEVHNG